MVGCRPIKDRVLCPETIRSMPTASLVEVLEAIGILRERPRCSVCDRQFNLSSNDLRIRTHLAQHTLAGTEERQPVRFERPVEHAYWRCPARGHDDGVSVIEGYVLSSRHGLAQGASLLWQWAPGPAHKLHWCTRTDLRNASRRWEFIPRLDTLLRNVFQ